MMSKDYSLEELVQGMACSEWEDSESELAEVDAKIVEHVAYAILVAPNQRGLFLYFPTPDRVRSVGLVSDEAIAKLVIHLLCHDNVRRFVADALSQVEVADTHIGSEATC